MLIGYCRVSCLDQNEKSQVTILKQKGAEKIFTDKQSGMIENRTNFLKMKKFLKPGDTVIVTELSRIGRSLINTLKFVEEMKDKNVSLISIRENIDISSPSGTLVLQIFSAIAEFERKRLLERQKVGIEESKRRGIKFGRPSSDPQKIKQALKLYNLHAMTLKEIKESTGISKSVLYREMSKK